MQKPIRFLIVYKYHIITLLLGGFYFWFLTYIHDSAAGDYQVFVREPLDIFYGIERWFTWSSRLLIEGAVNVFSKNLFIWQIVTTLLGAVLFWSIGRILGNHRVWQSITLLSLLLFVNLLILTSAGIFATTINYLWPVACFAFVVAIVVRPFSSATLKTLSQIAIWPLYIFAMCSEQLAVLGAVGCVLYIAHKLYTKQAIPKTIWVLFALSIVGVLNVLISPGNSMRSVSETASHWPVFESIPIYQKVVIGAIVTFSRLIFAPEALVIVLVGGILWLSYQRKNQKAFISILPAAVLMGLFFAPATAGEPSTHIRLVNYLNDIREQALFFTPDNLPSPEMKRIYIILFAVICVSILISLVYLYGKTRKTFIIVSALGAGLAVSLAVSLSPTLFASSTRTLYPFVIILLCADYVIVQDIIQYRFDVAKTEPNQFSKKTAT